VFAEMRYRGQSYELMIPWSGSLARLRRDFDAAHLRRYGHQIPDKPADIVNMLVQIRIPVHRPAFARRRNIRRVAPERARAFIEGRWRTIDHYERSALPRKLRGPAIIHEAGATTYVPPASYLEVDAWGNLVLEFR
jgi:N-methylhydantoinase A